VGSDWFPGRVQDPFRLLGRESLGCKEKGAQGWEGVRGKPEEIEGECTAHGRGNTGKVLVGIPEEVTLYAYIEMGGE
jgi:hypothetical protein